jgi:hypothetical protein
MRRQHMKRFFLSLSSFGLALSLYLTPSLAAARLDPPASPIDSPFCDELCGSFSFCYQTDEFCDEFSVSTDCDWEANWWGWYTGVCEAYADEHQNDQAFVPFGWPSAYNYCLNTLPCPCAAASNECEENGCEEPYTWRAGCRNDWPERS